MLPYLGETPGNASSIHAYGRRAQEAVELARSRVAELLGAEDPAEILFTSGATEAANTVIASHNEIAVSPFEHSAVREPALHRGAAILRNQAYCLEPLPAELVCVMGVNNETGAILEPPVTSALRFADLTQNLGKLPIDLSGIAFACASAHKLYGPMGVGCLYARGAEFPEPYLRGGEQEHGRRAGTLNVPAIVGFGAACARARDLQEEEADRAVRAREQILQALRPVSDWQSNDGVNQSPFILSLSIAGIEGETLVIELDHRGFATSAGAACSSRSNEPSHVLMALGLEETLRRGTIRISFGRFTTPEAANELGRSLVQSVESLRSLANRA